MGRAPESWTWGEVASAATPPQDLAEIAAQRPDLRVALALNPSLYPDLEQWLRGLGDPTIVQALEQRRRDLASSAASLAPPPPPPPAHVGVVPQHVPASSGAGAWQEPHDVTPADRGPAHGRPGKRRRGLVVALACLMVVLLGGGTAGALWWRSNLQGSASPEEAVSDLATALSEKDLVRLYGLVAPSERGALTALTDAEVSRGGTGGAGSSGDDGTVADTLETLLESVEVSIDADALSLTVETVVEDVSVVTVRSGSAEVTVDTRAMGEVVVDLVIEYGGYYTEADRDWLLEEWRYDSVDVEGTHVYTVRDWEDSGDLPLTIVTVEEGGRWYVSPVLTFFELQYQYGLRWSDARRGSYVIDGVGAESPEAAIEALADVAWARDGYVTRELVALLPLAERRVASLYLTDWYLGDPGRVDVSVGSIEQDGDRALAYLDDVWGVGGDSDWSWADEAAYDHSVPSPRELPIVVVREDGQWHPSVLGTATEYLVWYVEGLS